MSSAFYINIYKKNGISYAISFIHIVILIGLWIFYGYFNQSTNNETIIWITPISIITLIWTLLLVLHIISIYIIHQKGLSHIKAGKHIWGESHVIDPHNPVRQSWIQPYIVGQYTFNNSVYQWFDWLRVCRITISQADFQLNGNYSPSSLNAPLHSLHHHHKELQQGQQQKTPEDLFAFKTFETGDDPRRIVWKIYGKNRTLQVRKADDSAVADNKVNIILYRPNNAYQIDAAMYAILQSTYKRQVLDILKHWSKEATLQLTLDGIHYTYSSNFQEEWLADPKEPFLQENTNQEGLILINNFSKYNILEPKNAFMLKYDIAPMPKEKNWLLFRTSKESILLRKKINQTNAILAQHEASSQLFSMKNLATTIALTPTLSTNNLSM